MASRFWIARVDQNPALKIIGKWRWHSVNGIYSIFHHQLCFPANCDLGKSGKPFRIICIYYEYIYIYGWSPPPHDPPTSILYGNYQCFMHICFTRKMTFSCFYFFYLLRKLPTQTHTHMQFCFCLLFCHFLRFWSQTQKTLRKPKKTKLQNPCRDKLVS